MHGDCRLTLGAASLLAVGWLLQGCAAVAPPVALQTTTLQAKPGLEFRVQRGVLQVAESPGQPQSRSIELVFHRLPGVPAVAGRRTIVFIEGGPGVSANEQFSQRGWLWSLLRSYGDVLWVDQRGAGASLPQMACAEQWAHPLSAALPRSAMVLQAREKFQQCAATLRSAGADLNAYQTQAYADDIMAVTQALDIKQFDIVAYSYGTQIGLDAMRRFPDRLGRAVLVGVMGPDDSIRLASDHDAVLNSVTNRLPRLVPTEPLATTAPGAEWRYRIGNTAAALDANPLRLTIAPPLGATSSTVVAIDGFLFRRSLAALLNSPAAVQQIPAFLQQVEQTLATQQPGTETAQPVPPLLQSMVNAALAERSGPLNRRAAAQHFLTVCASGQSRGRQQQTIETANSSMLGYALHSYLPEACDGWGIAGLPEDFRAATPLATPTLLIAATWDMRTPYAQAVRQRQRMARSQLLTLSHGGHGDLLKGHAAVRQALEQWLAPALPRIQPDFQSQIGL